MLRLYLDEDSSAHGLVRALRLRGIDVLAAYEAGTLGWTDDEQLAFAAAQQRVLLTHNIGDLHRIHGEWLAAGKSHRGIIFVIQERNAIGRQLRRLLQLCHALEPEEMINRAEFLAAWD